MYKRQIFAYISPDHKPWRDYLISKILKVVNKYGIDNVHLDQATTIINDSRHNHIRGLIALFQELRNALPREVVISGEGISEPLIGLYPFATIMETGDESTVQKMIFEPYVRFFEYGYPTEPGRSIWSNPWRQKEAILEAGETSWDHKSFYNNLKKIRKGIIIPSILFKNSSVKVDSVEAKAVFEIALEIRDKLGL